MKRVLVGAVGASLAIAAAWVLVSHILAHPRPRDTAEAEAPIYLRKRADCMYRVLKVIPGVSDPELRYENTDGWNHPVLSYIAPWNDGADRLDFEAQKPMAGRNGYAFLLSFAGPPPPGLDTALMVAVINNLKARCQVDVDLAIN